MNIVKNEIRTRDNIIAQHVSTIAAERNAHAATDKALRNANAKIAEYERKFGVLN